MEAEKQIMTKLSELSEQLSIPVCIANDVHIPSKTEDDILARAIIRTTAFDKWENPTEAEKELYLKTDEELIKKLSEILPQYKVLEGYENIGKIASQCHLEIPKEKHYPKFVSPDGSTPEEYLRKMAYAGIPKRYPKGFHDYNRLEHELKVICNMGYADYHCIVEDFLRYARAAGKLDLTKPDQRKLALSFNIDAIEKYTKNIAGECVGPGRGSAVGSLVCYLIGITNIDPLQYGLLFERFLNPERVSMPDIDCDMESTVRPYVILYAKHKYGQDAVCGILTRSRETGKSAIRTAGRVVGIQKMKDSTSYLDSINDISQKAVEFSGMEQNIDLKAIQPQLEEAFRQNAVALEIIRYAILIENCMSHISQHAAGIIITDGKPVDEYIPLMYNERNQIMISQCDMIQTEEAGLLKIDFLVLNSLTIITETLREVYKSTGTMIDVDSIPFDEKEVFEVIFSHAMTNSVFQFESFGMKKLLRSFKPETIFDLILLVAMYRPGPMQFLENVIDVKQKKKKAIYLTPELEPILTNTYGSIAYQEQVQEIFKQLGGYSLGQADLVRRAMSKKKEKVLAAERISFLYGDAERNIPGCIANGIKEEIAIKLFDEMMDFAKYAFNKSHATCYAVVAYQTAWLKYHYPKEYMKAVLNHTKFEKIPGLISDLRTMQIHVHTPDINHSELEFSIYDGSIFFGLRSVKGLGDAVAGIIEERKKNGIYQSIADFVIRTNGEKKVLEHFIDAGVFDVFCCNRSAIQSLMPVYLNEMKKVKNYRKKMAEQNEEKKIIFYQEKLDSAMKKIRALKPDLSICEDEFIKLKKENERLGVFVSQHPMELFAPPEKVDAVSIAKALTFPKNTKVSIIGILSDFKVRFRRKDGAEMAFFDLNDLSGQIGVCCFTNSYLNYKEQLYEDAVIKIAGEIMEDRYNERKKKVSVLQVTSLYVHKKAIFIYVNGVHELEEGLWNRITPYVSQNGNPVLIYDLVMDEVRQCELMVSPEILQEKGLRTSLHELG
ncbi:DNA polymerase III subunit alpha [Clostridiaceae bacterium]|nr:DNA polymerase III subunit alpha [Clostridiaceae bacterium]